MKRLLLFELLLIFLATTFESDSPPPGWYQQTLPRTDVTVKDIFFTNSLNGWAVSQRNPIGDTSFIFNTTNGGTNWVTQYQSNKYLTSIQFVNQNTGYCAGIGPHGIMKTTNAGVNWFVVSTLAAVLLSDISFVNPDTGWTCSDDSFDGGIFKTTNGGVNWLLQAPVGPYKPIKLSFIDKDTGWVGSNESNGRLFRTTNGGVNWNLQHTFTAGPKEVCFVNKDTGWVTAGATGIMKTIDGGFNWFSQINPGSITNDTKLFFLNINKGWAGVFSNRILATSNGGINWGYQTTPAFTNYSVHFTDSLKGWAGSSILIHTTDGGGPITYTGIGINPNSSLLPAFNLKQNFPNPFNPVTNITFEITKSSKVSLRIFNMLGEEIDELIDYEKHHTGTYTISYEAGKDIPSGVYFYQMTAWTEDRKEIFIDTRKMILIK